MKRQRFRNLPIGRKLILMALLTTGFALFCFTGFSILKESRDWQTTKFEDMAGDADIVNDDAVTSLKSNSNEEITRRLGTLWKVNEINYGAVYDAKGRLFAEAGEARDGLKHPTPAQLQPGHRSTAEGLTISRPIVERGVTLGTMYLELDRNNLYSDTVSDTWATLLAAALSFALAIIVFMSMRRRIVNPIVELSNTMRTVSRDRNYAMRIDVDSGDEIGALGQSFNIMLEAVQERDIKLAEHQRELELTVEQRTTDLRRANAALENELSERRAAQEALHAHDMLLRAVTHSAAELLGALNLDDAINKVLELMGQALGVSRIMLNPLSTDPEGHIRANTSHEWFTPNRKPMMNVPAFQNIDLTKFFPKAIAATVVGDPAPLDVNDMQEPFREIYSQDGIRSFLAMPVTVDKQLWAGILFLDASPAKREWTWAETDTLATLARLIGAAVARANRMKELADANTIVQNSPTVLYRLKGEPTLPLTYISHNITKFGYDPKALAESGKFFQALVHPEDLPRLQSAMAKVLSKNVGNATIEFRLMLPKGTFRWVENRYSAIRDETGRLVEIEGIIIDITERKAAEDKIALLARTDALTGLANRATFVERLHQSYMAAHRGAPRFAVLYLDLDHFKDINDTRGHPVGDQLLREAGERLRHAVRETDLVARLGGDEFAVLQTDIADPSDAGALAMKIAQALNPTYHIGANELHVTASIGISYYMPDTPTPDDMLAQADLALYRAKEEGRNQYRFHSEDLDKEVAERVAMADELRNALARNEIEVYYQPQVELHSGHIVGMEALVRWHHPSRGLLMPAAFIPTAEKTGTILPIGQCVLEKACRQMRSWRDAGLSPPVMSVNVSLAQLKAGQQFLREVTETLKETGLAPADLELDVTESMLAQATLAQNDVLDKLRALGVRIALDDFGAEYSSFDYLRTYRVNHLKVARSFVEKATQDPQQAATIRAIIGAARELGIQVIAEGVETQEQRALLVSIGSSTRGAGFYFSEAVEASHATELLRKGTIDRDIKRGTAAE